MIKKLIYILILIIIFATPSMADTQNAQIQYDGIPYSFKPGDNAKFLQNANNNYFLFERAKNATDKAFYLQEAMRYYFLLSKVDKNSVEAQIGLGRIYDEMKLDRYAKAHFFLAYALDENNPKTNLYFGNYYYKRKDFIISLFYYKNAYNNGYSNNYYLNQTLGVIYEKLGDLETAKNYFRKALAQNNTNTELKNKIYTLNQLNYSQSQYYLFQK